jgi:predicted site-specific integrase-resolvase
MNESPRLLKAAELAEIYQTTPSTILSWHRQGRIPAEIAEGRVIRFSQAAVAEALRKRAENAGKGAQ